MEPETLYRLEVQAACGTWVGAVDPYGGLIVSSDREDCAGWRQAFELVLRPELVRISEYERARS